MGKIYVVRHGQDTDNATGVLNGRRDTELTNLGREQARQVGEKLCDCQIQIVYSSPLKRAYETAEIIAGKIGLNQVIKDANLIERDFGVLTGKPMTDISKYASKFLYTDRVNYFLDADEAETFPSVILRGKKVLSEIEKHHLNDNVLLVTHGDTGKMIRAAFYSWDWEYGLKTPYFENTGIIELSR